MVRRPRGPRSADADGNEIGTNAGASLAARAAAPNRSMKISASNGRLPGSPPY
jgi:hypothetical protein